jgi:glycosyltransferase involved in cell wall biosynthesis
VIRVKVAHIATSAMSIRHLLRNQVRALEAAGYEVTCLSAPGPELEDLGGVRHIPVPMTRRVTPWADGLALGRLFRVLRRERFTVVHTHTPKAGLLGQYAAALARVPLRVHTIHGLYYPGHMKPRRRWAYTLLERATMFFSDLNLSQNEEDVPVAVAEKICAPERIEWIGNGIDLEEFDPALQTAERRLRTRRALGLGPGHKVVGMVARFIAEKGCLEVLRAAQVVRRQLPEARFLFIGPAEPWKRDGLDPGLIVRMGLADVALFLGRRTDMPDLYAAMDVLALPSHREGFPRAPMEAAAMGVPAVVTNVRGCRQAVEDGVTGHLVPLRDPQALAEALLDLLSQDDRRRAWGRAARAKARAEFDERRVFSRVLAAYDRLLAGRGLRGRPGP